MIIDLIRLNKCREETTCKGVTCTGMDQAGKYLPGYSRKFR